MLNRIIDSVLKLRLKLKFGQIYEGNFRFLKKDGPGKLTYRDGAVKKGNFKAGKLEGLGTFTYPNGDVYEGDFKAGKPEGRGILTCRDGTVKKGNFRAGKLEGLGTFTTANGGVYEGEFKAGKSDGQGTFIFRDGTVYKGNCTEGKLEGLGIFTYANGDVYEGEFKADKLYGLGKYTLASGDFYEGTFKNGESQNHRLNKKDQTVLVISKDKTSRFTSPINRYKQVEHFDDTSVMDAKFLDRIVTKSTKGDKKNNKVKVVIDDHGGANGDLANQDFYIATLKNILHKIEMYNQKNNTKPIHNFDIVLTACHGSNVVALNKEFKEALKCFVKKGINVKVSAGDENHTVSMIISNNKNPIPSFKTNGYYINNEYSFSNENDLRDIKPYKVKKYKTIQDFLDDSYVGKRKKDRKNENVLTNNSKNKPKL